MKILKNKNLLLASTICMTLASAPSFAENIATTKTSTQVEQDSKGNYIKKTLIEGEDLQGTKTSNTKEVNLEMNADGSYKKTTKSNIKKDPEGLFNASEVKSSETIKSSDGEYSGESSTKTKNGITGTNTSAEDSIELKADDKSNVVEKTVGSKVVVDPKGLMNKRTSEKTEETEQKKWWK